jgi:hypothetical protein
MDTVFLSLLTQDTIVNYCWLIIALEEQSNPLDLKQGPA